MVALCAVAVVGLARPASAAANCDAVAASLHLELRQLSVAPSGDLRTKAQALFETAGRAHPECATELRTMAAAAQAAAKAPGADAKGFLGPIGWIWNTVYYRVYQGNAVMMIIFGWGLLLAPILVVVCAVAVLRGATGVFRRPTAVAPPALKL